MKKIFLFCGALVLFSCLGGGRPKTQVDAESVLEPATNTSILQPSLYGLPYDTTTEPQQAEYHILEEGIEGMKEYMCGEDELRYISLPSKDDVSLILVPMDCGDFPYRYYLLTIKNDRIVDSLYVEGEWWEPEDDNIETTYFSIDESHFITVTTESGGTFSSVSYIISHDGELVAS